MDKKFSALVGVVLILIGILALAFTLATPILGLNRWQFWPLVLWQQSVWRLWPLAVVGLGALLVLPPVLVRRRRGLGALFIPGLPILTTGAILLFASVSDWWKVWSWLWPQEVLALALGFLFAAITMRVIWLLIPAIIIGLNGVLFQLCALTGLWEAWAVLWVIEPLALGLAFLVISARTRSSGLFMAGLILCGLAGIGLIGMTAILSVTAFLPNLWLAKLLGPAILILIGLLLVTWNVILRPPSASPATE